MSIRSAKIKLISAREILNSRGEPTVEVKLVTNHGEYIDSAPSGASKGKAEAIELKDSGEGFKALGVAKAIQRVNEIISPALIGESVEGQEKLDKLLIELDGTKNKSKLGVNAILPVSLVICRAAADDKDIPLWQYISRWRKSSRQVFLPRPCFNLLNGGKHAGGKLTIQEFMIVPQAEKFQDNLRLGAEIYYNLKKILEDNLGVSAINLGDEGGFVPSSLEKTEEALDFIIMAITAVNSSGGVKFALDCAASELKKEKGYNIDGSFLNSEELLNFYQKLTNKYPFEFLEDPFGEEEWENFQKILLRLGEKIKIVGDDLLTTNPERIRKAYREKAVNGVILKPNQIGTLTETIEATHLAQSYGWKTIVSHRSGETNDDFIADLAVGLGADFIKTGAPARGERVAKYNRLLAIEKEI